MSLAALPTDFIVIAAKAYGIIEPNNRPVKTQGFKMSTLVISARTVKAPKSAKLTKAADPMAKPLPISAVVLPAASKQSVRVRTFSGKPAIPAMPPALSEM